MDSKEFKDILDLKNLKEKIFRIKTMYHPNLIANLSKEMYDRYTIRMSLSDDLFELLEQKDIVKEKVKEFIESKIANMKDKHERTKKVEESKFLQIAIEEWEDFLTDY